MRIEEYSPRWQEQVSTLADRVLGTGFFESPAQIARDALSCVFVAIEDNDEVAGFVRGRLLPKGGLDDFLEHKLPDIPKDLQAADAEGALGVIQTIVVAPEHRGKGLGTRLLQVVHDKVIGRGADKLIVTFKRESRAANVDRLMEKLGFEFWLRLETYWKRRCDLGEFVCVDRGDACTCEAVFYRKKVF
jgi:GNAT superfamily N-acetyltransferase